MGLAEQYISDVMSDKIVVGKWIKLVIQRHLSDLEKDSPYYFDPAAGHRAIKVFSFLKLAKGKGRGTPFPLLPWQACILFFTFGWKRKADNTRRFKRVYVKVARKNGKTEFLAGIATIFFLFDKEVDPEVYWGATKKEQAKIGWGRQKEMISALSRDFPEISAAVKMYEHRIVTTEGSGLVAYLGKDSDKDDGLSPSFGAFDEIHAYTDTEIIDVIESGMGARDQPMTFLITTAGKNQASPNTEFLTRCKRILEGILENDVILPFIYELDDPEKWEDETQWIKANPSLGSTTKIEFLRDALTNAQTLGLEKEIDFKVKNLNIEMQSSHGWIKDELWQACPDKPPANLAGATCYGGLDLAQTSDFSSLCLYFPEHKFCLWWMWLPEATFERRIRDNPSINEWEHAGWISLMPGNTQDYDYIENTIRDVCAYYDVQKVGIDPANATQLRIKLEAAGLPVEAYGQGIMNMSPPTKEFARLIERGELNHGGNPVARWMLSNVFVFRDANDNIKLHKGKSADKIDGIVAAVIAIGENMSEPGTTSLTSHILDDEE